MTRARILADYVAGGTTAAEFDHIDGLTSTAVGINDTQTLTNKTLSTGSIGSGVTGLTGVKNCDTWRITSNFTVPGLGHNYMTTNWERDDTGMMEQTIGTGITESSGIFSFPSTGLWLILAHGVVNAGSTGDGAGLIIWFTRNNSSYASSLGDGYTHVATSGHYSGMSCQGILDVTDVSNVKVKLGFWVASNGSSTTLGGWSTGNGSAISFIRIGDT